MFDESSNFYRKVSWRNKTDRSCYGTSLMIRRKAALQITFGDHLQVTDAKWLRKIIQLPSVYIHLLFRWRSQEDDMEIGCPTRVFFDRKKMAIDMRVFRTLI